MAVVMAVLCSIRFATESEQEEIDDIEDMLFEMQSRV